MLNLFEAWQYCALQKATVNAKSVLEEGQIKIQNIKNKIANHKETIKEIDQEVEQITQQSKSVKNMHNYNKNNINLK